jgi:Tfp pilus assembly PilM family ATPase
LSLVRFEKIPAKVQDLDQLIRWQVRKAAPFKIEDAQVSWVPGVALPEGGREYVVTVARRDIIESYERACEAAGAYPGIVDLATVNLINAVLGTDGRGAPVSDWLLVHIAADYSTMAVVRGSIVISFRTRPSEKDDDLADLVHQTAMYYQDRLQGAGFARVLLAGGAGVRVAADLDQVRQTIEDRLTAPVSTVDPRAAVTIADRISAAPALLDMLTPLVGLLLRDRKAAMVPA